MRHDRYGQAQVLLSNSAGTGVDFLGTGSYATAQSGHRARAQMLTLAGILDGYNNNEPTAVSNAAGTE